MKLNKDHNTVPKLDATSYTDEVFGISQRIVISHFSKKSDTENPFKILKNLNLS